MQLRRFGIAFAILVVCGLSNRAFAQYTPTISGVSAFWWLGSGILADGGTCSGHTGPCYYAQSQLTSNPNGAPGTPSWTVVQNGQGRVSLSCNDCANPVATAESPSGSCYPDIQIYVSYGGYSSAPFNVTIVAPSYTNLSQNYPQDYAWYPEGIAGFQSYWAWDIVDSCGFLDGGIDANEAFGTFVDDIANDWISSAPNGIYLTGHSVGDMIAHAGGTPAAEAPQSPLATTAIRHDSPWAVRVGSQSIGSGTPVRVDTQQWWIDHGSHY